MKREIVAGFMAVIAITALPAQTPAFRRTVWPKRIAVGMRSGEQLPPLTVEATKTGWITINFLSTRPDAGLKPPPMRMMTDARDLRLWIASARAFLKTAVDTAPYDPRGGVRLGNGRYVIEINHWGRRSNPVRETELLFAVRGCGPGQMTSGLLLHEVVDLLALLDTAVRVAGGGEGRPPTLSRPYYASEVSCPVLADGANSLPQAPPTVHASDIGAQFVVDTLGLAERGSIQFLPGTDSALARSARATIVSWHFTPAEIDGTPVRQIVQMPIVFRPDVASRFPTDLQADVVEPTDEGWVHLVHAGTQEWFDPDSVDGWVARVRELNADGAALPTDTNMVVSRSTMLGFGIGVRFSAGFFRHGKALAPIAALISCGGAGSESEKPVGDAGTFADAARQARARRSPPVDPGARIFGEQDVACPAWFPWTRSSRVGFTQVWQYPVGVYPSSMRASNARADVLASFVVDTMGLAEPSSLVIMPGSDRRAAGAIPETLRTLRFRPATRAGRKVRERVIQSIRFEPPPECVAPNASPICPRRYSDK